MKRAHRGDARPHDAHLRAGARRSTPATIARVDEKVGLATVTLQAVAVPKARIARPDFTHRARTRGGTVRHRAAGVRARTAVTGIGLGVRANPQAAHLFGRTRHSAAARSDAHRVGTHVPHRAVAVDHARDALACHQVAARRGGVAVCVADTPCDTDAESNVAHRRGWHPRTVAVRVASKSGVATAIGRAIGHDRVGLVRGDDVVLLRRCAHHRRG